MAIEAPDIVKQFAEVLQSQKIKPERAETIAKYIYETGEGNVFEDPEQLSAKLAEWHDELSAPARRRVLMHWFTKIGKEVPSEVLKKVVSGAEAEKLKKEEEKKKEIEEGRYWQIDEENLRPRLAKEGEKALTLSEVKEALKEIKKTEEAPIIIFNEKLGKYIPNPASEFAKKNPEAAWATAREYNRRLREGEEVDPVDIFIENLTQTMRLKEALGIETTAKTTDTSLQLLLTLDRLGLLRKWEEPNKDLIALLRRHIEEKPEEDKQIEELTKRIDELKSALEKEREERRQEKIRMLEAKIQSLESEIERARSEKITLDEYALISKGIDVIDKRLSAMESTVKGIFLAPKTPPPSPQEREGKRIGELIAEEAERLRETAELSEKLFFKKGEA